MKERFGREHFSRPSVFAAVSKSEPLLGSYYLVLLLGVTTQYYSAAECGHFPVVHSGVAVFFSSLQLEPGQEPHAAPFMPSASPQQLAFSELAQFSPSAQTGFSLEHAPQQPLGAPALQRPSPISAMTFCDACVSTGAAC